MTEEPAGWHVTDWQTAELLAASWLRQHGFEDAHVTQGGSDGGIDVTAAGAAGQVKFEATQVGRPALQRLVGATAHRRADLFFFTGTGYSKAAHEYADEVGIILCVYDLTGQMSVVGRWQPDEVDREDDSDEPETPSREPAREPAVEAADGVRPMALVIMVIGFGVAIYAWPEVAAAVSDGVDIDDVMSALGPWVLAVAIGSAGVLAWFGARRD